MDSATLISELKRFVKDNRKAMALLTIIVLAAFLGVSVFSASIKEKLETPSLLENTVESPAIFQFYVLNEDGTTYENSALLEEYFLLDGIVNEVEKETGVPLKEKLEEQEKSGFIKTQYDRGIVGISRNGSSNVFTANAKVGTAEENLAVMEAYFDYLTSETMPVLQGKQLNILRDPENKDYSLGNEGEIVGVDGDAGVLTPKKLLLLGIVGLFGGFIFAFFVCLIYQMLKKVITYSFSFSWEEQDTFLYYSKKKKDEKDNQNYWRQLILHPASDLKVILSEQELEQPYVDALADTKKVAFLKKSEELQEGKNNVLLVNDILQMDPLLDVKECIIVVESGKTHKEWYRRQKEQLKNYQSRIKIIQVIA